MHIAGRVKANQPRRLQRTENGSVLPHHLTHPLKLLHRAEVDNIISFVYEQGNHESKSTKS